MQPLCCPLLYPIETFWTLTIATWDDAWYFGERRERGEGRGEGDEEGGRWVRKEGGEGGVCGAVTGMGHSEGKARSPAREKRNLRRRKRWSD